MTASVLDPVRTTFHAVATTVVPETASLDAASWRELESRVEGMLAARPEPVRKQLVLFLRLIEWMPLLWHGQRFTRLAGERRHAVLKRLERDPRLLVRRGFWGLRTLVFLGYYTQPRVQAALGYRAHPDGWQARRRSGEHAAVDLQPITLDIPVVGPPDAPGA